MSAPLIGGVLVLCFASSAGAYMFSQGGEESKLPTGPTTTPSTTPTTPSTTPTTPSTTPTATPSVPGGVAGYSTFDNFNFSKDDETCEDVENINVCSTKCDYDPNCLAFTFTPDKECCIKYNVNDVKYENDIKTYFKLPTNYQVNKIGDRTGGVISSFTDKDFEQCSTSCNDTNYCTGFSFQQGMCELKQDHDLTSRFYDNGKQFFKNTSPKLPGEEVFYVDGRVADAYAMTKGGAASHCASVGAELATEDQVSEAQIAGADWCATGWVSDSDTALYPITTTLISGCGNGSAGIKKWTPPSKLAGVNCYGVKPAKGTQPLVTRNFNAAKWSSYD